MEKLIGTSNKFAKINLTTGQVEVFYASKEDRALYTGGKGLGLRYYYDMVQDKLAKIDPLGEDNILCFMLGVITGTTAPCAGRFEGITKSPLTGIMVTSTCGGPFGIAGKTAGWDGLFLCGKAKSPVKIIIDKDKIEIEDANDIWGLDTHATQEKLGMRSVDGAVVIGPAGENLVPIANICSGHRFLGRGGMGAVMGSKNVKAIIAKGNRYKIEPAKPKLFEKTCKRALHYIQVDDFTRGYKDYGTNFGVRPGIKHGFSPVYNFKDRTDPRVEAVSGEVMAERYNTTHSTCRNCSVLCGHKGTYPDGKTYQIPEYETIGLFGPNIGNFDPDLIGKWNEEMNLWGYDTISAGNTIAWAMEAGEKGIYPTKLRFEHFEEMSELLKDIAYRKNEGKEIGEGVRWLSKKYGGQEYACHVKGMEMAAYDPRGCWGQGLSYAVNNRGGCHLGSYLVAYESLLEFIPRYTTRGKAVYAVFMEDFFTAINNLHTCLFTAYGYLLSFPLIKMLPKPILKLAMRLMPSIAIKCMNWNIYNKLFYSITGQKMGMYQFKNNGKRAFVLERYMNNQLGITKADDTLPKRFTEEAETKHSVKKAVNLEPMLKDYYKLRKYDENGVPTKKELKKLKIKTY